MRRLDCGPGAGRWRRRRPDRGCRSAGKNRGRSGKSYRQVFTSIAGAGVEVSRYAEGLIARWGPAAFSRYPTMLRRLLLAVLVPILFVPRLHAQPASMSRPEAVYTPAPVYRPEWAKQ